jgi:tetratricopeptide (TPR) repeat protein
MLIPSLLRGIFSRSGNVSPVASQRRMLDDVLGLQHAGDLERALSLCGTLVVNSPGYADARFVMGTLCGQTGRLDEAFSHLSEAIALAPELAEAHIALGNVHKLREELPAAEACYRAAVALDPDSASGHYHLGLVLRVRQRYEDALTHARLACALDPAFDTALDEQALCLIRLERHEEAVALLQSSISLRPQAASRVGFALQRLNRPHEALACFEKARGMGGGDAELWNNIGWSLQDLGENEQARAAYDKALALQPDYKLAEFHRALVRLLRGDYAAAWPDYELRLVSEDHPPVPAISSRWQGEPLDQRSILVFGEQGLGDEIMFASCLPDVLMRAEHCTIGCSPKLQKLFRRSFPRAEVLPLVPGEPVPPALTASPPDFEVPVGSLPLHFRRGLQDFPAHRGYLVADPDRVAYWRRRLDGLGSGLKIGFSWQGGTVNTRSRLRSIPLDEWLPLLRQPGTRFISLQYGNVAPAIATLGQLGGSEVVHWQESIDDYDETAALVSALDLTISVCTSVIHLAGALGRPVLVLAPVGPEWRYGIAGHDMAWYPSVRIFRQRAFGEWRPVIDDVAHHLGEIQKPDGIQAMQPAAAPASGRPPTL